MDYFSHFTAGSSRLLRLMVKCLLSRKGEWALCFCLFYWIQSLHVINGEDGGLPVSIWFPKLYDKLMGPLERNQFYRIRKQLIDKAAGRVLEIGSGTGINFPFYERQQQVIAVEPEPRMAEQSLARAEKALVPIELIISGAEELPFPDNHFDSVVGTLVLCTIPVPTKALAEIRRVCKPHGTVLFFEHVKLRRPVLGGMQELLTPVWKRICDGCHLNRDALTLVKNAGFQVTRVQGYAKNLFITIEAENDK